MEAFLETNGIIAIQIIATLFVTSITTKLFRVFYKKLGDLNIHRRFIKDVISAGIWLVGILISLSWLPDFTSAASALVTGSGIIAITVGLAAQEPIANAFNGLFISISKPFEVGDRVHLVNANITGIIEDITIRHTVIRTFVNSRIIVPNALMSKELIENSHIMSRESSSFIDVIITYDSDLSKASTIIADAISSHPDFVDTRSTENKLLNKPIVPVLIRNLGLQGAELRASMWTSSIDNNFSACSDARKQILKEFQMHGIKLATANFITSSDSSS